MLNGHKEMEPPMHNDAQRCTPIRTDMAFICVHLRASAFPFSFRASPREFDR